MSNVYLTEKRIPMDVALYSKIMQMKKRIIQKHPRWDCVLGIDGTEGIGKSTLAITIGYIIGKETGRKFNHENVFADTQKGIDFAQTTEGQIIIFDEPSNDALSVEFRNKIQINLIKLLMQCRTKRHFIIFNFTKFYKFAEYIVVDRCIGLLHIYQSTKTRAICFVYIPGMRLEKLYNDYRFKKIRNYFQYKTISGSFVDVLHEDRSYNILDEFDFNAYQKIKEDAILTIGKERIDKFKEKYTKEMNQLKNKIGSIATNIKEVKSKKEFAEKLGVAIITLNRWNEIEV